MNRPSGSHYRRSALGRGWVRAVAGALLLLGLASPVIFRQVAQAQAGPAIRVTPASAAPGALITITGTGFPQRSAGQLYWSDDSYPTIIPFWGGGAGTFQTRIQVPNRTPGSYQITITAGSGRATTPFTITSAGASTVTPAVTVTPTRAPSASPTPTLTPAPAVTVTPTPVGAAGGRRVIGYFPIWVRNSGYTEQQIDFSVVTHVAHFSVVPNPDGSISIPDWGPFPDPALVSRTHAAGAKIVLVIGTGDSAEVTAAFSTLSASAAARQRFVTDTVALVSQHGYDGIALDWEFPESTADRANLTALVRDLRAGLGPTKTISLDAPASDWYGRWLDVAALAPMVDWVAAMTYDLHGPGWSGHAGHNAALYASPAANALHWGGETTMDSARAYYLGRGLPASKLVVGIPFFGKRFDGASALYTPLTNTNGGSLDYKDITPLMSQGWSAQRDSVSQVPYLVKSGGAGVVTYDDPVSVGAKCAYVAAQGVSGVILWHLGKDRLGSLQPLLSAARPCR